MESKLELRCPNCDEENTVKLSSEIKCKNCKKDLAKWKYGQLKQKVLGASSILLLSVAPAYEMGKYMYVEKRYHYTYLIGI